MAKIAIIGCGNVGMAAAYPIVMFNELVNEVVLIDIREEKVQSECLDLTHAAERLNRKVAIKVNDYAECANAEIVIISACVWGKLSPPNTRRDLGRKNYGVIKGIVESVVESGFSGIFLVATNPLDVIVQIVKKISGFPKERVIGTGTSVETARLRSALKERNIPVNIETCFVIGEHGDSMVVPWSMDKELSKVDSKTKEEIRIETYTLGYKVLVGKGYTNYAIGICLSDIVEAILSDRKAIDTICFYDEKEKLCYSRRAKVGKQGIVKEVPTPMDNEDKANLDASIKAIRECLEDVEKFNEI